MAPLSSSAFLRARLLPAGILLTGLLLAGCARQGNLAPVEFAGANQHSATAAAAQGNFPSDGYVVQRGDTLYGIARRFNQPPRGLIEANNLQPPYSLQAGQTLRIAGQQAGGQSYTVVAGDTLYGVARRFGVDVSSLVRANQIEQPYGLKVGQTLTLPGTVVASAAPAGGGYAAPSGPPPGPSIAPIIRRPPTGPSTSFEQTALAPPPPPGPVESAALPPPGKPVPLPPAPIVSAVPTVSATALPPPPALPQPVIAPPVVTPPVVSAPVIQAPTVTPPTVTPPVVSAAPLPAPAGAKSAPVASAPGMLGVKPPPPPGTPPASDPVPIAAPVGPPVNSAAVAPAGPQPGLGATIPAPRLPGAAPAPPTLSLPPVAPPPVAPPPVAPAPVAATAPPPPAAKPAASDKRPASAAAAKAAAVADTQVSAATPPPPPPPRGGRSFLWPVRGRVLATYGEQGKGLHNDGLNIAAPRGTAVRAAENGVVAYSGNEIRGFGNLVLIRHADGYTTAYAHLDNVGVNRGDTIRRGQPIGNVGSTGNVDEPQLHFEIRQGSQAVDPQRFLGDPTNISMLPGLPAGWNGIPSGAATAG